MASLGHNELSQTRSDARGQGIDVYATGLGRPVVGSAHWIFFLYICHLIRWCLCFKPVRGRCERPS